jgi:hypothetical protein
VPERFDAAIALADPVATRAPTTWFEAFPNQGYGDDSRRLLAVASEAWVFGGMAGVATASWTT